MSEGFVEKAIGVVAKIEPEFGHWVVYLEVSFWKGECASSIEDSPIETVRRRITTYATRDRAEMAASFMARAAARNLPQPPMGF